MNRLGNVLVFAAIMLAGTGCWPARLARSPGASGTVLDAQTRAPIRGAKAVMCEFPETAFHPSTNLAAILAHARTPLRVTDQGGRFSIPRAHQWVIYYPSGVRMIWGTLVVRGDGYEPAIIPVTVVLCGEQRGEKLGTVLLTPVAR